MPTHQMPAIKKVLSLTMTTVTWLAVTTSLLAGETKQFKVLELDQNSTGPYAIFSGGTDDGLKKGDDVCVLKDGSDETAFCAEIVNVKRKAAAFYIPAGRQFEVMMGTLVNAEINAAADAEGGVVSETESASPWFLPGSSFELGYHLQVMPAIKSSSMSFEPLPRADTNAPWKSRDAINMALAGVTGGFTKNFLNPNHHLGIRGFYAQSTTAGFDNDYDLTDTISHVESNTAVKTLGLSVYYGVQKKSTNELSFRGSAGAGVRQSRLKMTGELKTANTNTLASANLISTAPVIDLSGGAAYKLWGIDWSANLLIGIPLSVKTTASGTFNEFQDVSQADIETNITDAAAIQKGTEVAVSLSLIYQI